jgi:urea transport system substrate-binding protein
MSDHTPRTTPATDATPDFATLLDPAQAPDELGRIGTFAIKRLIGFGGMGMVFEAEDTTLHRRVAVKVLRPDLADADLAKRFLREARAAAALHNDHIVTIFQVGEHNGFPFLVMEYLKGEPLDQRLERDGWLPVAEALDIGRQVAEGLKVAHAEGLVHRDVKPANIWLVGDRPGTYRRVKLLDFGLAKPVHRDDRLTDHGQIVGTPFFMAPEQIYGGPIDGRTDLFALGCVLYRAMTGRNAFAQDHTTAALRSTLNDEVTTFKDTSPQISRSVAEFVSELLNKDPDRRPTSAAAVVERIKLLEGGDSVALPRGIARPVPPPAPGVVRPPRPHFGHMSWEFWLGAAMILAALLVFLAALIWRYAGPRDDEENPHKEKAAVVYPSAGGGGV